MAQHSPYTPGELATDVPGREAQLGAISERLAYMIGLRRLIGRIRLDQAPAELERPHYSPPPNVEPSKWGC